LLQDADFEGSNLGNLLNIGKNQEKCRFESGIGSFVESGFVSFNRVGGKKTNMLNKLRTNKQKKTRKHTKKETQDYRLKSAFLLTFFISFPMFSRFPKFFLQNQHFVAKFPLSIFFFEKMFLDFGVL
jgi:hypothetical protein